MNLNSYQFFCIGIMVLAIGGCSLRKSCCKYSYAPQDPGYVSSVLKPTSLSYLINYGPDSYDLVANFDVLFLTRDTSTNGCTAHIHGKYGELVKSEVITMSGKDHGETHVPYATSRSSNRKYYIVGTINRPDTEEIRERNTKAFSIHVEENYISDYSFK